MVWLLNAKLLDNKHHGFISLCMTDILIRYLNRLAILSSSWNSNSEGVLMQRFPPKYSQTLLKHSGHTGRYFCLNKYLFCQHSLVTFISFKTTSECSFGDQQSCLHMMFHSWHIMFTATSVFLGLLHYMFKILNKTFTSVTVKSQHPQSKLLRFTKYPS